VKCSKSTTAFASRCSTLLSSDVCLVINHLCPSRSRGARLSQAFAWRRHIAPEARYAFTAGRLRR
jgi:hypothetical protein